MGDREAAGVEFGEQRLDVAQDRFAGGGVADVADGRRTGQALDRRGAGEMVADQALPALRMEPRAVEGDDARRLLAAMLQGVQPQRGDRGGVGMSENAENAALLAQPVVVEIQSRRFGRHARGESGREVVISLGLAEGIPRFLSIGVQGLGGVGTIAGAAGAGSGTPLLIDESSFCLSVGDGAGAGASAFLAGVRGRGRWGEGVRLLGRRRRGGGRWGGGGGRFAGFTRRLLDAAAGVFRLDPALDRCGGVFRQQRDDPIRRCRSARDAFSRSSPIPAAVFPPPAN